MEVTKLVKKNFIFYRGPMVNQLISKYFLYMALNKKEYSAKNKQIHIIYRWPYWLGTDFAQGCLLKAMEFPFTTNGVI